jgi:hypothetical protein
MHRSWLLTALASLLLPRTPVHLGTLALLREVPLFQIPGVCEGLLQFLLQRLLTKRCALSQGLLASGPFPCGVCPVPAAPGIYADPKPQPCERGESSRSLMSALSG